MSNGVFLCVIIIFTTFFVFMAIICRYLKLIADELYNFKDERRDDSRNINIIADEVVKTKSYGLAYFEKLINEVKKITHPNKQITNREMFERVFNKIYVGDTEWGDEEFKNE